MGAIEALRAYDWPKRNELPLETLDAVVECAHGEVGDARLDVPIDFAIEARHYVERRVKRIKLTPLEVAG